MLKDSYSVAKAAPITVMTFFAFDSSSRNFNDIHIIIIFIFSYIKASCRLGIPGTSPCNGAESGSQSQVVHLDGTM